MAQEDARRLRQSKLPLFSSIKLRSTMPMQQESVSAGEGIEFAAIRPYDAGDDLRDLDLQTLAQSGEEEIIQRVAGSEQKVYVWADWSGSMATAGEMLFSAKPRIRNAAMGLLLFSAWNAGSPVGFCAFDGARAFFQAKSGLRHCAEIWDWIGNQTPTTWCGPSDAPPALDLLLRSVAPQSMVFFISDFHDQVYCKDSASLLQPLARAFDFIPVVIRDPLESGASIKWPVTVAVQDSEGDGIAEFRLTSRNLAQIEKASAAHLETLGRAFTRLGVDHVVLDSPSLDACYRSLASFFEARARNGA